MATLEQYEREIGEHGARTLASPQEDAPKKPSMMEEAILAHDRLLNEQRDIVTELEHRLAPVCSQQERGDGSTVAKDAQATALSPYTNAIMGQTDMLSYTNKRLRALLGSLEV